METDQSEEHGAESDQDSSVPYAEPAHNGSVDQDRKRDHCPGCGSRLPDQAEACPGCGRTLYDQSNSGKASSIGLPGALSLLLVFSVLLVGFSLGFLWGESGWEDVSSSDPAAEGVLYRVMADGPVSVTYRDRAGNIAQEVNVPTPWTYPANTTVGSFRPGLDQYLQVTAQKVEWKKEGRIKVQILVDGTVWMEDECTGNYCMVSVDDVFHNAPELDSQPEEVK